MNKLLTIIIPTYNMEKYLDRCLSSLIVCESVLSLLEILVINDGSKDRSSEIAHTYETRFPDTFRVIDKKNGHYGSCINKGLACASGKYIKVLDADDYFAFGFVNYLAFLGATDTDLVLTDSISIDEEGNILSRKSFNLPKSETVEIGKLTYYSIYHFDHFNITYKTSILKEIEYRQTEGVSYTDLEWSTLPVSRISSAAYCPEIVYCYLKGRAGQSIDIAYRKNNMWMENSVVLGITERYETVKGHIPSQNYHLFRQTTAYLARQIYYHYLLNFPKYLDETELLSFDEELHRISQEIYELISDTCDNRKFGNFYYIRDFRNKRTRKTLKYRYFDFCVALGAFYRFSSGLK